ncbi:molybdate ABC transporter substrate-binding protein [Sulfurimonas sp. SAG-AH-194-I05]|nr:molybdate ABC transporter substrate-binding protein [Sulfurimonas sp. SAG-AH-194-I05]MDF1874937.1 molybdate ABC transporter substrate-binding protein [Sulfurimonas sp. SAG-AH-194-I05]
MFKILFLILILQVLLFGNTVTLAVAANVSYAIQEIKKEFEKQYPHVKLRIILGSSGKLYAQIKNHAPYDIFMSANMMYPQSLYHDKQTLQKPHVYAQGSLAVLSVTQRDLGDVLTLFQSDCISKIALANPKTAPYGKASFEALRNAKILEKIKYKVVYGESISQTLSYTVNATDIGIVATSALYSPKLQRFKKNIHWVELDSNLYTPIQQGMVLLKRAKKNKDAQLFYTFMLEIHAQKILQAFGYTL